jgi:tetratricopeptide (TPR) repeat protein
MSAETWRHMPTQAVAIAMATAAVWASAFAQTTPADQPRPELPGTGQPGPAQPGPAQPAAAQPAAAANEPTDPKQAALRVAYDAAFQDTLNKPADPAVLVKFAEIAVEAGDVEGAISALERLLLIDGDQAEVKLELGVLYFRLGSTDTARAYLEAARDSDSATDDIRKRADTFLKTDMKK